jgi:hypothetical protein
VQNEIINNSLKFKSITFIFDSFADIPNSALYQHLQNPTTPIKFAKNSNINVNIKDTPINCVKIKNSQVNFIVPGKPQYNIVIINIAIPKLGVKWINPTTSKVERELNRRCIQSTKKNINADKNECVTINKIALIQPVESPQHSII